MNNSNHCITGTVVSPAYSTTSTNSLNELLANSKIHRDYRIDLTKAENSGFVIQIYKSNTPESWSAKPKIYINTNIEDLGKDIQNALMVEILKD